MNRENRRKLGVSKVTSDKYNELNSPCTITEAVQLARGVTEDMLTDYQRRNSPLQVSLSLQVEVLKAIVIKSGLVTEEELTNMYRDQVDQFNSLHHKVMEEDDADVTMSSDVGEIEIIQE